MTTLKSEAGNPLYEPGVRPRMVLVTWRDCKRYDGYETAEDCQPWVDLWSIGFVLRQDADGISIGQDRHNSKWEDRMRCVCTIPTAQILKVEDLEIVAQPERPARRRKP